MINVLISKFEYVEYRDQLLVKEITKSDQEAYIDFHVSFSEMMQEISIFPPCNLVDYYTYQILPYTIENLSLDFTNNQSFGWLTMDLDGSKSNTIQFLNGTIASIDECEFRLIVNGSRTNIPRQIGSALRLIRNFQLKGITVIKL